MRSILMAVLMLSPLLAAAQQAAQPQLTPEQVAQRQQEEFSGINRYRNENAALKEPSAKTKRVVFLGDSITDYWGHGDDFFPGKHWLNRGISGQTTTQMLLRFPQDVVALHPEAVVILAGVNDIAQNNGPETMEFIEGNFRAMVEQAKAAHIRVVLCSVLPTEHFDWRPNLKPADQVRELNVWLEKYAESEHLTFLNYYPAFATVTGGMNPKLGNDTVHPNAAGYAVMKPMVEKAIAQSLATPAP